MTPAKPTKLKSRDHDQLQQLIARLTEGIVLVDLDQSVLWANDAALEMHGVTNVADLGATIDEYRERFILTYRNNHPLKAGTFPVEQVIAGDASGEITVEVSPVSAPNSHWTQTLRCFVINDSDNVPDYLVLVIKDETARFEAEDRFESSFKANPAPAVICRLKDLCFVRVNSGFLEMTGCVKEDVIDQSIYQFDVLGEVADRQDALRRLKEGSSIPLEEAALELPSGAPKPVILAGEPIDLRGEPCMLFTFVDLEPRVEAERALIQSEERFSKAFKFSPVAFAICDLENLAFIETNDAFHRLTGLTEEQLVGYTAYDLDLWADKGAQALIRTALKGEESIVDMELEVVTSDNAVANCLLSAQTISIADLRCVLLIVQDISDRVRNETELLAAVETVMSDTSWFSQRLVEKLGSLRQVARQSNTDTEFAELTLREREVLGLVCEGKSDAEMAEALGLSPHTIRNHLTSLYRKIGVKRRAAAVVWARDRGILQRPASKNPKNR